MIFRGALTRCFNAHKLKRAQIPRALIKGCINKRYIPGTLIIRTLLENELKVYYKNINFPKDWSNIQTIEQSNELFEKYNRVVVTNYYWYHFQFSFYLCFYLFLDRFDFLFLSTLFLLLLFWTNDQIWYNFMIFFLLF